MRHAPHHTCVDGASPLPPGRLEVDIKAPPPRPGGGAVVAGELWLGAEEGGPVPEKELLRALQEKGVPPLVA